MNSLFHLAQLNIAKIIGVNIDDPVMKTFVDQLDEVNAIAEGSSGFVWRLKDDDNNATGLNPFDNEQIIVNMSVWESIEDLLTFVYKGRHSDVLKNRKEWFVKFGQPFFVLWHIPAGHIPTIDEAKVRLAHIQQHGPTEFAFDFKTRFPKPSKDFSI